MLRWVPYPFIRLTLAFVLGILLALGFPHSFPPETPLITTLLGLFLMVLGKFLGSRLGWASTFAGFGGLLALSALGYQHTLLSTQRFDAEHLTHISQPITQLRGTVVEAEEERNRTWRTELAVSEVRTDSGWQRDSGIVLLYQRKDSLHQPLQ